jgi:hypothetical protein
VERGPNTQGLPRPVLSPAAQPADESLVHDARANLTPSQAVERRLVSLLKGTPLPLSRLRAPRLHRPRP